MKINFGGYEYIHIYVYLPIARTIATDNSNKPQALRTSNIGDFTVCAEVLSVKTVIGIC